MASGLQTAHRLIGDFPSAVPHPDQSGIPLRMFTLEINPARTPVGDPELAGVFDRAFELFREMIDEYRMTQNNPDVGERAKNLFHE